MTATQEAFDALRKFIEAPRKPPRELIANSDELKLMTISDGLTHWVDGGRDAQDSAPPPQAPLIEGEMARSAHLWVVRCDDVVHAPELCAFGLTLQTRVIKHTNLTGGDAAYSGGEVVFIDAQTIVVNGCSGRYGPRSREELDEAVTAFSNSGFGVWSMGFDQEANRPYPFGTLPNWVSKQ